MRYITIFLHVCTGCYIYLYVYRCINMVDYCKSGKNVGHICIPYSTKYPTNVRRNTKKISCTNKEEEIPVGSLRSGQKQPNINDARIQINKWIWNIVQKSRKVQCKHSYLLYSTRSKFLHTYTYQQLQCLYILP